MIQLGYEHLCLVINYGWRKQILSAITIATLVVMASTSFLGAQPDVNWNLTNTNDSQNSENDCTGLASQTDTAEDLPCQSYSADLYETTGDVEELCDTDLLVFRVGCDGTWFYWELELAGSWDVCSAGTGSGRHYMVETDTDQSSEADNKGDFIIQYEPEALHCRDDAETEEGPCDTDWDDAGTSGDGKVTLWEDSDNDYGYTGAGQGGTATGSDSQDPEGYTGYEDKKDPTDGQLWARIITRGGKNVVQLAVLGTALGSPSTIFSRPWSSASSSINNETVPYHAASQISDIVDDRFDNMHGAGTPGPPSGPNPTPVSVASMLAMRSGGRTIIEWSTVSEAINAGFNLYGLSRNGWVRSNSQLIPSSSLDLLEPQSYEFVVQGREFERFQLADVDFRGSERKHGPFLLNERYGEDIQVHPIDWDSIRAEHRGKTRIRAEDRLIRRRSTGGRGKAQKRGLGIGVEFEVDRTGIYRVTYSELQAAGFDLSGIEAGSLALFSRGQSVPIRVQVGSTNRRGRRGLRGRTGRFGPGGFIEFYGEAFDSLYTRTNVYRLLVDSRNAERVDHLSGKAVPGAPTAPYYFETFEQRQDRYYYSYSPTGDPWVFSPLLVRTQPVARHFAINLTDLATEETRTRLEIGLFGVTNWPGSDPDHHVIIEMNGKVLADKLFDGLIELPLTVDLSPGLVRAGNNNLTFRQPADTGYEYDLLHLDGYSLRYPRAFLARDGRLSFEASGEAFRIRGLPAADVVVYRMAEGRMSLLEGAAVRMEEDGYAATFAGTREVARYAVWSTGSLLRPGIRASRSQADITSGSAEYLIISHPDFVNGLTLLKQARRAGGLSVKAVDVEDVYAQFGNGIVDPEAIRAYIAFAVENLGARYVLLVGGDTYDYLDHRGLGSISFIPSLYTRTGEVVAFTPSDPLLADIDGDFVPDVPIGRFPVRTTAELHSIIRKTLIYPNASHHGTALFVADRDEVKISFAEESERMIERLPGDWIADRAYLGEMGAGAARVDILAAMNEGRALINFFGHSGPTTWTFDGLFRAVDAETLANAGTPMVVIQWGCWNTYHVTPAYNTLAHQLLLNGDRGAALVLGSSTLTHAVSERQLASRLLDRMFEPGMTIGWAVQEAKADLASTQPDLLDVILGWTLLGDPAMKMR